MQWILIGAFFGLVIGSVSAKGAIEGGILGALLGALVPLLAALKDIKKMSQRLDGLAQAQNRLATRLDALAARTGSAAPTREAEAESQPQRKTSEPAPSAAAKPEPPSKPAAATETVPPSWTEADERSQAPLPLARALDWLRDYFTTGNVVARVGVIILFFGLAFLLKYAAERAVIPMELRLAGVALAGIALLLGGWRLRSHAGYGLILQGAGIGTLYLTTFTALRLYDLLPPLLAFALMVLLVGLAASLALLQNSPTLATLGSAGGFLAPVLTSSGDGNHILLFTYYALLNAGILAIAWHRAWRELNLLGFAFTFVIASLWGYQAYRPELFASTQPFLALFFLFYLAIAVLFARRQPPRLKGYVDATLVFGVPLAAFTLQVALVREFEFGLAISAVITAGIYLSLASALWRRQLKTMRVLVESFLSLGVIFLILAVPLALDGSWTAAVWALQGAALVWIGVRQRRMLARLTGALLQLGAGASFWLASAGLSTQTPILNAMYLGGLLLSLAALFSAACLQREPTRLQARERWLPPALLSWGLLWWLSAGLGEIQRQLLAPHTLHAAILFLGASAFALDRLSRQQQWRQASYPAIGLLPVLALIAIAVFMDGSQPHLFTLWGALAWLLAGAVHLSVLASNERSWPTKLVQGWHMGGLWLTLFILAWEANWLTASLVSEGHGWQLAAWALPPAMALYLLPFAQRPAWPIQRPATSYCKDALLPVAVLLWLWLLGSSLNAGHAAPLPYLPLLNPIELSQFGVLLVLVRAWVLLWRERPPILDAPWLLPAALAGAAFIALNGVLARAVHYYTGVPHSVSALYDSIWFQSGLSILWSILAMALMTYAARTANRVPWVVGAALLSLVVLKLFLLELANAGTLGRIVSFVAVGLLMLLIGYLSPLPPRRAQEQTA